MITIHRCSTVLSNSAAPRLPVGDDHGCAERQEAGTERDERR